MASELETLVAELRSIAAEIARLRPGLVRHAAKVRQAASEVAAAGDGRSATTAALLQQAGRECEAVAAELANAERAAQHFAGRVVGTGMPEAAGPARLPGGSSAGAGASGSAGAGAGGSAGAGAGGSAGAAAGGSSAGAGVSGSAGAGAGGSAGAAAGTSAGGRSAGAVAGGAVGGAAGAGTAGAFVPWWIPDGAPWHGHAGRAPRRGPGGEPLTRFGAGDLARPEAAGSAAKGGHGGAGVPPARVPVTDTSRDLVAAFVQAGYRSPDCLPAGLVQERCFWMDQSGHPVLRHAEIPDSALISRVLSGHDPITGTTTDWETGKSHKPPRHATTFTSRAALVFAEGRIWNSHEFHDALNISEANGDLRCDIRFRAGDAFPDGVSAHLRGWTRSGPINHPRGVTRADWGPDSIIIAVYRRVSPSHPWTVHTMYPKPQ
jgi:hypothetical protein